MTETLTIHPAPARDLKPGDKIRHMGETRTVMGVATDCEGISHIWYKLRERPIVTGAPDETVDVVLDAPTAEPEPEPEQPAWPTAPLIRITDGTDWNGDIIAPDTLALRIPDHGYVSEDSDCFSPEHGDEITEWEDLTPIRTNLLKELRKAEEEVDAKPDGAWAPVHLNLVVCNILDEADRSQP